jgi:hypothetical protein
MIVFANTVILISCIDNCLRETLTMRRIIQIRSHMKKIGNPQCCGSGRFISDPGSEFFPSRIRIFHFPDPGSASKNKYFNPKNCFLSSRKYYLGCPPRIRILIFLPILDPGVKKASDPGSGCATLATPHHPIIARNKFLTLFPGLAETRQNFMLIFRLTGRQTLGPDGNDLFHGRREV